MRWPWSGTQAEHSDEERRALADAYRGVFRNHDRMEAEGEFGESPAYLAAHEPAWRLERTWAADDRRVVWREALAEHEAERE